MRGLSRLSLKRRGLIAEGLPSMSPGTLSGCGYGCSRLMFMEVHALLRKLLHNQQPLDHLGAASAEQFIVRMHIRMLAQVALHSPPSRRKAPASKNRSSCFQAT
jgi:hypothetical protein